MYKSHRIINSNGCPSFFLLTSAHRLFITQAPLTSVNTHSLSLSPSLFFTPQWPSGCSWCSQTHSYLSTLVLAVLSTWNALLPQGLWLTPPLHSGLCSNITSFKKPFPPPYLQCLPCPSLLAPFNLFFLILVEIRPPEILVASPSKKTGREITLQSFTYFIFLHSTWKLAVVLFTDCPLY